MNQDKKEKLQALLNEIADKRNEWKNVRSCRLNRKQALLDSGLILTDIRKEREYSELKKRQKRLSKEIKHLGRKYFSVSF